MESGVVRTSTKHLICYYWSQTLKLKEKLTATKHIHSFCILMHNAIFMYSVIHGCFEFMGFSHGWEGKASACNAGDLSSNPKSGRSAGEGNGNPLQYSCLENSMNGGAWQATVHGIAESHTTELFHFWVYSYNVYEGFFCVLYVYIMYESVQWKKNKEKATFWTKNLECILM